MELTIISFTITVILLSMTPAVVWAGVFGRMDDETVATPVATLYSENQIDALVLRHETLSGRSSLFPSNSGMRKRLLGIYRLLLGMAVSNDGRYLALGGSSPSLRDVNPLLSLMLPGKGKVLVYRLR